MRLTVLVLFVGCATATFAQSYGSVLSNEPVIFQMAGHAEHAAMRDLATPRYSLQGSSNMSARGVQPLWEFPVVSEAVSLGDAARALRKQHALGRKAQKVMSDQQ
jgi:hypothetical protein